MAGFIAEKRRRLVRESGGLALVHYRDTDIRNLEQNENAVASVTPPGALTPYIVQIVW